MSDRQIIGTIEDREAWLKERKLGASDAATILGLNPYKSPRQLWLEKIGSEDIKDVFEETEAMKIGRRIEPVIAEHFGEMSGKRVFPNRYHFRHPQLDFITATPDWWAVEPSLGDMEVPVEIKNVGVWMQRDWSDEGIPDQAHCQAMMQCIVTCSPFVWVAGLIGGNRLAWRKVEFEPEIANAMVGAYEDFWNCVQKNTPPALTPRDNKLFSEIYVDSQPATIDLGEAGLDAVIDLQEAQAELKSWEAKKDLAQAKLKDILRENDSGRCDGYKVTWKQQTRKSYVVEEATFRVLRVTKEKARG